MNRPPRVEKPLFMLDYDGTLAEIVVDPDLAYPHPDVPVLLQQLREQHPVYIVTGRSVESLSHLLKVPNLDVVGVHGMEVGRLGEPANSLVATGDLDALGMVRQLLPNIPYLNVEDKGLAIALHYRHVDATGTSKLKNWAETLPPGLDKLWGKQVLELRPQGYSKGRTAVRLAAEHLEAVPVFIGDDTTDEEAFAALSKGLSVKVGDGETRALSRLPDVASVIAYLKQYV